MPGYKILMGSVPQFGQLNPLLAIAECLIARGHEIHFASGSTCQTHITQFNARLSNYSDTSSKSITFHDLGHDECINSRNFFESASPAELAAFKQVLGEGPRNVKAFSAFIDTVMNGDLHGRKKTMDLFIDLMEKIKPDILVLDQFTSCFIEAARVTGANFIVTAPASPSTLGNPPPFSEPLSGTDFERPMSLKAKLLNVWYGVRLVRCIVSHPAAKARREYKANVLKLPPINKIIDSAPFSRFHSSWTNQKAIISSNVDFHQQTLPDKVIFVGTCLQRRLAVADNNEAYDLSVIQWLDQAAKNNDYVVYVNFGTIFRFIQSEVDEIFEAVRLLNKRMPSGRAVLFLWKVPHKDLDFSGQPSQVKILEWLQDPLMVYDHVAIKACMNHGGGNSFNEALQFGIPQLVCAQWFDTIDYAVAARSSGIGLSSEHVGRLSAVDISTKITRLLTEKSFTDKTLLWSSKSRAAGGSRAAADVIETYLDHGQIQRSAHLSNASTPIVSVTHSPSQERNTLKSALVVTFAVLLCVPVMASFKFGGRILTTLDFSSRL